MEISVFTVIIVAIFVAIFVIAILVGAAFLYKKHQYVKAVQAQGWTWVESPDLGITVGLNVAPFGIGFSRKVDNQIIGRGPLGVPFQAFRYVTDCFRSDGYVINMKMPKSLPAVAAFPPERPRNGAAGFLVSSTPLHVVATQSSFGAEFASVLLPMLPLLMDSNNQPMLIDVGVDHDQLVMLHVPVEPQDVALAVAWLERVCKGLDASHAMAFEGPPALSHLSFQYRDHWSYQPQNDAMLSQVRHSTGGSGHEAKDIVISHNYGLPFIRLTHTWVTTHTTSGRNGTTTTTTQQRTESICEFRTSFHFRELSVNWGMFKGFGGDVVSFESAEFNQQFKVRCAIPRFASDVFHPRQLEYFLRTGGLGFIVEPDGLIRVEGGSWSPAEIDRTSEFLHGFFARIPDFTWKELGAWPRPIAEVEDYSA